MCKPDCYILIIICVSHVLDQPNITFLTICFYFKSLNNPNNQGKDLTNLQGVVFNIQLS